MCASRAPLPSPHQRAVTTTNIDQQNSHAVSEALLSSLQRQRPLEPIRLGLGMVKCPRCERLFTRGYFQQVHSSGSCSSASTSTASSSVVQQQHPSQSDEKQHSAAVKPGGLIIEIPLRCLKCDHHFGVKYCGEIAKQHYPPCRKCGSKKLAIVYL